MNITSSSIKTDKLILEAKTLQNITSSKRLTENYYDDNQQNPSVIYKDTAKSYTGH